MSDFWVRRKMVWGQSSIQLFGTYKQAKRDEEVFNFCPRTFARITGLDVGKEMMHIKATFEVVEEE